jgi:type III restriction enzyme
MINLPKGLFGFQEDCVSYLMDKTTEANEKKNQTIIIKSPTGSGKTIILIAFIDRYIEFAYEKTAFVWLCPGDGELEEQSKKKMEKLVPHLNAKNLQDVLTGGFEEDSTTFINWQMVTNKNNKSITENECKNLFDRIAEAHRNGLKFIVIVDEEHKHNTTKANDIINAFSAKNIIRVSATAKQNKLDDWYEIEEIDVINSGLITRAMYINEDVNVNDNMTLSSESKYLIELADKKRKEILTEYKNNSEVKKDIRPLVIIQFPNSSNEQIEKVENQLEDLGYTYENKMVAKWMADTNDKINIDNITELNASPAFLLIKQAISTGWDCPRAKILIKLRENMSEDFEIQTIGRIRRMPEAKHYDNEILDCCYLYTFDEKYKKSVINNINNSFEITRLFLKDKCKTFKIEKELRDLDYDGIGLADIYNNIYYYLIKKYKLGTDKRVNKKILENNDFRIGDRIFGHYIQGRFITLENMSSKEALEFKNFSYKVNTHDNGLDLLHSIDIIKKDASMTNQNVKIVLRRLFSASPKIKNKILSLNKLEWYAFIINNVKKLRDDFIEVASQDIYELSRGQQIFIEPKKAIFTIPLEDKVRYDPTENGVETYLSNAYNKYTTQMTVDGLRSTSERLFEQYCERKKDKDIEWVYKNGDTGQQYLSIVYIQGMSTQFLFYPDYIVKKKNGEIWIIETKGGEQKGRSKNIDIMVKNKFHAFKNYAKKHDIKWGFVRDKNSRLFINNTIYNDSLSDEAWKPLNKVF